MNVLPLPARSDFFFFFLPSVVARHVCANQSGPLVLISPTYISLQINDTVQEGRSIGDKVKVSPLPAHGAQGWDEGGSRGGGHTKLREVLFFFCLLPEADSVSNGIQEPQRGFGQRQRDRFEVGELLNTRRYKADASSGRSLAYAVQPGVRDEGLSKQCTRRTLFAVAFL